jgi:uncharacterized DUF497 family protein
MAWNHFIWTQTAIDHMAEHGVSVDDFEYVVENFIIESVSRSSGRPIRFGETTDGRILAVVFEWIEEDLTVEPVTAFDVED